MDRWWLVGTLGLALAAGGCGLLGGDDDEEGDGTEGGDDTTEQAPPLPDAQPLSAGEDHTCAVQEDGDAYCWGRNLDGELGDGTGQNRRTPVRVADLTEVHQISAGRYHTCALKRDGTVWCWGRNNEGQLGDGTTEGRQRPVQVSGIADATMVGAGHEFSCALRRGGNVMCWGNGEYGRLGNGNTEGSHTPVEVAQIADATQLTVGGWHGCVRTEGGNVWCWGADDNGQAGIPTDARSHNTPQQVPELTGIAEVVAGHQNTCARHEDGHLSCWGDVYHGVVGNGASGTDPDDQQTPHLVEGLENVTAVGVGVYQACALLEGGAARCWGHDGYGNLGTAEREDYAVPTEVQNMTDATAVAVGGYHVCMLRGTGAISCFGKSGDGQLGQADVDDAYHANDRIPSLEGIEVPPSTVHTFAAAGETQATPMISAGDGYACGVRSDGHVLCWGGSNSTGQLGNGSAVSSSEGAVEVAGISDAVEVRTSQSAVCARRANGQVACWGYLGRFNGSEEYVRTSLPVPLTGVDDARGLAMSSNGPCVLHEGGTVSCAHGAALEPVSGLTEVAQIAAGGTTHCAVLQSGGVRCWGSGRYGQLGQGEDESSLHEPVEVRLLSDVVQMDMAYYYSCARRRNGAVSCWGNNEHGELGNGESGEDVHENTPQAVRGVRGAVEVSTGARHACARMEDHSMQCWGENDWSQLGTGQEGDDVPELIARATDVADPASDLGPIAQLECGWHYCCTLHESGQLQCWGRSSVLGSGMLGGLISPTMRRPTPLTAVTFGSAPPAAAAPAEEPTAERTEEPAEEPAEEPPPPEPSEEPADPQQRTQHRSHRTLVQRAVHAASRSCYGRLGAHGTVTVRITVGPDGRVTTSRVVQNGTGNQETGRCISGALVGQRFSRPRAGAVTYDIAFNG